MDGECYHYIRIQQPVPKKTQQEYSSQLLPALVAVVNAWWDAYREPDKSKWTVRASQDAGIRIEAPDQDAHYAICCPRDLNGEEFDVGWQHRHYGRERELLDPKFEIAERMIDTIKSSRVLRDYLFLEEKDDIRVELLLGEYGDDSISSSSDSEMLDFTACGKECDYCGHCPY